MNDRKKNILMYCDKISWVLMCIAMLDISIFGAGKIISFGPIGFRHVILLLLGISCIPLVLDRWKILIKNKFLWMALAIGICVLISMVRGIDNKNLHASEDFIGFAYLIFLPLAIVVINSKDRIHSLMKIMILSSLVLAFITIIHLVIYICSKEVFAELSQYGYNIQFSRTGHISKAIPRLYMLSGLYMISGCAFSLYFTVQETSTRFKNLYYITPGFCLFALLLSYTRSIYLGVLVAAAVTVVYLMITVSKKGRIRLFKQLCVCAGLCLLLCGVFRLISGGEYLRYAFSRSYVAVTDSEYEEGDTGSESTEGDEDDELSGYNQATHQSDMKRELTVKESIQCIQKSPLIGHGLGFTVPSRPDGNEYSYLDIWLKMGLIGLVLYMLPFIFIIVNIVKTKDNEMCSRAEKIVWLALLLGIMSYSLYNPYINSALGIFAYCCTMVISENKKR